MRNLVRLCCALAAASLITAASSPTAVRTSARARAAAGVITVNSTADVTANDGQCTLREALNSAANDAPSGASAGECAAGSGDDTVNINVTGTIDLTDMLSTTTNVSIVGPGSGMLTLRSTGTPHRVFFKNVSTVSISGLTMTKGGFSPGGGSGGGLINGSGPMTLTDVVVTDNHTPDENVSGSGGGIYNSGTLTMVNCVVSGNSTGNSSGGQGGRGGGIDSGNGSLTLIHTVVTGNSTGSGTGGGGAGGGPGGGIFTGVSATLTDSTVSNNSTGAGAGTNSANGGEGGGIYSLGTLTLTGTTVSGNSTGKGGDGAIISGSGGHGGGILNGASATITDSTVSGNKTGDGGHAFTGGGQPGGAGGGVFNSGGGALTLTNSAVGGNATGVETTGIHTQGGGISSSGAMTITGSLISGNTGGDGSGIDTVMGSVTITNSTVSGNVGGDAVRITSSPTTLTNCTIASNPGGGVIVPEGSPGFPNTPPPTLRNTIIALNGADLSGAYNSQGHNLVGNGDGSAGALAAGDQVGSAAAPVNPRLGPLADNGGPTKTHALLAGSPALDAGDNSLAKDAGNNTLATDQRGAGFPRFADAADADATQTVDIGAFEAHPTVEDISNKTAIEGLTFSLNFNVGDEAAGISSVTAASSNAALVPNNAASLSVTGTGSQRTLNITAAAGASGTTTVTVTVTAANGRTASDTFLLTVLPATTMSSVSGSGVYAGTATLTAKLTAGGVGGPALSGKTVVFMLNGSPAGSATTDAGGVATQTGVPLSGFNAGTFGAVVIAIFPGDANFGTSSGAGSLTVAKADTTTAVTASNATYDGSPHGGTASVTGPGGLNQSLTVTYAGRNSTAYGPSTTAPTNAGDYTASASFAGDSNYNASSDGENFSIAKASQTITFDAIPDKTFGDPDFTINATASSGLPVSFGTFLGSSCTVTGNTVHINDANRCMITATQFGDSNYNGAAAVSRAFEIAKASTSVTVSSSVNPSAAGQSVTFTATVTSPAGFVPSGILGTVGFSADGVTIPNCGSLLSPSGQGSCTTSALSPGRHTITADYGTINQNFTGSTGALQGGQLVGSLIEFGQPSYAVAEGAGLTVTVTRTGVTTQAVSVDYLTDDGSAPGVVVPCSSVTGLALDRCDYTKALGTLHFAAGETSKTLQILVGDDSYAEGPETAHVRLSRPSSAGGLGTNSSATFTITDDSPESAGNVIDDTEDFVRQHYRDFLNREPDAAGLAFWVNEIEKCGGDAQCREVRRINVSAAFFKSIEFQETGYLVERAYKVAFGDTTSPGVPGTVPVIRLEEFLPDTQQIGSGFQVGVGDWQPKLEANKQAYFVEFVSRLRFANAVPISLTPAQFVDALFANAGVTPTAEQRQDAINEFGGGVTNTNNIPTRARVLRRVAENPALGQQELNRAFVLMEYFGYLRRNPDDAPQTGLNFSGWKFWLSKLEEFNGDFVRAEMVKAFLASDEYRRRFGQ